MIDFIQRYWLEAIFGGAITLLGFLYKQVLKKIKKYEYTGDGVKALLYDRLRQSYSYHIDSGFISIDDFNCFSRLYDSYHNLGGNGAGTEMLARLKDLPPTKPKTKECEKCGKD